MIILQMFFGDLVSILINAGIIVAMIVVVSRISGVKKKLDENENAVLKLYDRKRVRRDMDKDISMTVTTDTKIDPDKMNDLRQEYDRICVEYSIVSQLIPIFPSLGILGTVAGLMFQVAAEGIDQMTSSIGMALSSTFLALLFTIILKYMMAVSVSKKVNEIDVKYRDYERHRQDLVDKVKLVDEE